ncbi:MAG: dihydroxyacetone kinase subunit DhaL [Eubacteriales bacterium]
MKSIEVKNMLLAVATMFQEKMDELAKLDAVIGDGDHGISMARGAEAAYNNVSAMSDEEPQNEYFKVYGRTLVAEIGGAMGPLFGTIFTEYGKEIKDKGDLTAEAFAMAVENSAYKVMEFGGAKADDKTMVDAMIPAAKSARTKFEEGGDLLAVAYAAVEGAKAGVEYTVGLRAKRGRSKFLQEKSIGYQDAGATSYYYLTKRIADYLNGDTEFEKPDVALGKKEKKKLDDGIQVQKFINEPKDIVDEMISGFTKAYSDRIEKLPNANVIVRKTMEPNKVGVVIGNGSGHEPACIGFVGENMLDANAYGGLFAAPGPYTTLEAIKAADNGNGVCVLISSHAGDILNSQMAIDMAEDDGILAKPVLLYDDIASAPKDMPLSERRGAIGTMFNYKMTSSYASGHTLKEIISFAEKVRDNTRSVAAAMTPGTSPINGEPMFTVEKGEVLVGLGVHGESALMTYKDSSCSSIAEGMISSLIEDKPYEAGDEVAVIINGSGGTTMMELLIFFDTVEEVLAEKGIKVFKPLIGSYITTQEMGGIGLAICKVDQEMKEAWEKPTDATHFPNL